MAHAGKDVSIGISETFLKFKESHTPGYYRSPTLAGDEIVFVSEDDLWSVPIDGGVPRRLTSGLGKVSAPSLSPDGRLLAFSSSEEGHAEVFVMSADGGEPTRMSYLGCETRVIGWSPENEILFASNHEQAFSRLTDIYAMDLEHREYRKVPCGPATHIDFHEDGRAVIARRGGTDLAYWKRYRGGLAGEIWIDRKGDGNYTKLLKSASNSARPFWIHDRIYFVSDDEGIGNIFSVNETGEDLRRHTDNKEYYVRGLCADGTRLVYHAGGDIYVLDLDEQDASGLVKPRKVEIDYRSPRTQVNRRFVSAAHYLEDYDLHPKGDRAVIAARGKTFSFDLWKGPVFMHGQEGVMRYRLGRYLNDGKRIVLVSDAGGEEALEIHDYENRTNVDRLTELDLGRTLDMKLSPTADEALLVNHRNELIWVDLQKKTSKVLDRSQYSRIFGFNWSYDGNYVAYSCSENERTSAIRICDVHTGKIRRVTKPLLRDTRPVWDPDGEYLYFLSYREFDPVYDNLHFDLSFVRGCKPYLITLRKDVLSPFSSDNPGRSRPKENGKKDAKAAQKTEKAEGKSESKNPKLKIDFEGIEDRIIAFPVADGRYGQLAATREKVYYTRLTIKGSLSGGGNEPSSDASLEMFDLDTQRSEHIANVTSFRISQDNKHLAYRSGNGLRVVKTNEKPNRDENDYRKGGWLDLGRVQIPVRPRSEWRQMYREAWRLQRDHFWTEDMSKVDWQRVYERYLPLLYRAGSRSEVSDVIWEMQGELGTSHAYEIGGDYRPDPHFGVGQLGMMCEWSEKDSGYRIRRLLKGDLWDETASSPLARAGVALEPGDLILAIDGQPLTRDYKPHQALVHRAGREVSITFRRANANEGDPEVISASNPETTSNGGVQAAPLANSLATPPLTPVETVSIKTLRNEQKLRYRDWVERNREYVHKKSKGKLGYIHVPNMGPFGYAEFHRSFLTEIDRDGLVIDVRFNGGGHVSQLLLEKLARRRIGYSKSRWFGVHPFPDESPSGPMVALTNEYAGSDGDIFSHSFKLLKLGPLIGKRTWGGVIGISPSHSLVDGGYTTQPEYSFWFSDVGWKVENYGTEPDIEVDYPPADYVAGRDPQLDKAIRVCVDLVKKQPAVKPSFDEMPNLALPDFPEPDDPVDPDLSI